MEDYSDLHQDFPAPSLNAEALKFKSKKASAKLQQGLVEKLLSQAPAMIEIDGRLYPRGSETVAVNALPKGGLAAGKTIDAGTDGHIPDHVDVEYVARLEPQSLRRPKFIERGDVERIEGGVKTVFGDDGRRVFYSTAYPWRCNGRVESSLGVGSGVMVGPRHLLTASHMIDWRPNNTTGWLKFTPMYYNGSAPYGSAWAVRTYCKIKVTPPTIDSTEAKFDYVVVVLDRLAGNATGWLGTKSYSDSWDGGAYWTHVGYPGDLTGTQRPIWQGGIALDGDFWSPDSHESMSHRGDVWPGQSGGPFWGYWGGQPYAVAVQSAHNPSNNFASGGSDMVDLVIRARTDLP